MRSLVLAALLTVYWTGSASAAGLPSGVMSVLTALQDLERATDEGRTLPSTQQPAEKELGDYGPFNKRDRRSSKSKRNHALDTEEYQLWLRSGECQRTLSGEEQFFCPTPATSGNWQCVPSSSICNGVKDCPGEEDELPVACFFYKVISRDMEVMSQSLLRMSSHIRSRQKRELDEKRKVPRTFGKRGRFSVPAISTYRLQPS